MRDPIRHDDRQAALLARIIVVKYGSEAPRVAAERARLWVEAGDEVTASLWTHVAHDAAARLTQQAGSGEAKLPEILDGAVTRQVMQADGVSRDQAEQVLSTARDRLRRK